MVTQAAKVETFRAVSDMIGRVGWMRVGLRVGSLGCGWGVGMRL